MAAEGLTSAREAVAYLRGRGKIQPKSATVRMDRGSDKMGG